MDIQSLFGVQGKIVIVTGGGRGVGAYIAEGFVKNGAKVYITGRKNNHLEVTTKKLNDYGKGKCIPFVADLSKEEDLNNFLKFFQSQEKKLDVLINNAGATWGSELEDITVASYDRVMNLNVKSLFFLTIKLLPQLKAGGTLENHSRVINIGSLQGIVSGKNSPVYDISKAAVHHLSKSLGGKLSEHKVLVNAIALGAYETAMTKGTIEIAGRDHYINNIPLKRAGNPEEIAGLCIFLSSKGSGYITGTTIIMDGGVHIGKPML